MATITASRTARPPPWSKQAAGGPRSHRACRPVERDLPHRGKALPSDLLTQEAIAVSRPNVFGRLRNRLVQRMCALRLHLPRTRNLERGRVASSQGERRDDTGDLRHRSQRRDGSRDVHNQNDLGVSQEPADGLIPSDAIHGPGARQKYEKLRR